MKPKHKFKLIDGHQVQEVSFKGDDTKYYEFLDANMAPCHRMYAAMQYYNELKQRCDREYLIAHFNAVLDCINGKSEKNKGAIDIVSISNLTTQALERVEWILEPESVLKYASVIIFDENENPYDYDMKYNMEAKIKKWREMGLSSFFLSQPVKRLFPALNISKEDLDIYLKTQSQVNAIHLKDIFTTLSNDKQTGSLLSIAESLKQRIQASEKSSD